MREIKDNERYPGVDDWDFIFNFVQVERSATICRLIRQIEYEKYQAEQACEKYLNDLNNSMAELAAYRDFELGHGEKVNLSLLVRELNRVDTEMAIWRARAEKAEAELAHEVEVERGFKDALFEMKSAREKAEAEVERLKAAIAGHEQSHPNEPILPIRLYEGGGRESDTDPSVDRPYTDNLPANPVARKEIK